MTRNAGTSRACAIACALVAIVSSIAAAQHARGHRTFAAPHDAVQALITAVSAGNVEELLAIFGPDGEQLVASSDPATARRNREVFSVAVAEKWQVVDDTPTRKTLVIGNEEWPFPVPIVKDASGWRFDTAAGREEIIARRIGRNELAAIDTCRAYVTAQRRYAQDTHDGKAAGVYAKTFNSDPGKENGLYWPVAHGQKRSPLGELVAQAAEEGRPLNADRTQPSPLHGYYFKILTSPGGFALVAWPAEYNVSGVMTFLVNQDGIVREKDLGTGTDAAARHMTAHNPDSSWRASQ
jgi:Protein of unknown function (DUF2950)